MTRLHHRYPHAEVKVEQAEDYVQEYGDGVPLHQQRLLTVRYELVTWCCVGDIVGVSCIPECEPGMLVYD